MKKYAYLAARLLPMLALILLAQGCAVNPVTGKRQLSLMSSSQEVALGLQYDPSVVAEFGLYSDAPMQQFIDVKGQQMAKVSHRPDLKYEFKILDSPVVNAFAVPGGFVYFTRGIMAHFNNEAEFAGVLGHEIGHITARHGARQYSNQMLAQIGLIAGMVLVPEFQQFGDLAGQGLGLLFLKYGRDNESESDRLGVEYSTKIGYDAKEMANFFGTLNRLSGGPEGRLPTFLSTHPDPGDRRNKVGQLAGDWRRKLPGISLEVNRNSYLRMIDGLVYGEDPRQGFVENGNFYHPELKFQFPIPGDWQSQNSPQSFKMAPKDGKALMVMTLAAEKSLDAAAQTAIQQYKLKVTSSRTTTVNGLQAIEMVADIDNTPQQGQQQQGQQQQQPVRMLAYFISYNGLIYQFMGLSLLPDFNSYQPRFQATMQNFRALTDAALLNRQPDRIRIETVAQNGTLEQTLRGFNTPSERLEEVSILNGMELNTPVSRGMLIKTVGK